jgi:hypothetical protein
MGNSCGRETMPEGNEIHRWAERHNTAFVGKKLRIEAQSVLMPGRARYVERETCNA